MPNFFKTILLVPLLLLLFTIIYGIMVAVLFVSYFVVIFMMPTKTYGYLQQLEEYNRIKQ